MMRIAVAGASGRMGRMLVESIVGADDAVLVGALDVAGSAALGQDAVAFLGRPAGVPITSDLHAGLANAQVLIDFTRPEGTLAHLAACHALGVNAVIGTTGFSTAQKAQIAEYAQHIAIMLAPNMSVGVNVVMKLLDVAARAPGTRATTSRSSRRITVTRSTPPAAPRCRWARSSRQRSGAS